MTRSPSTWMAHMAGEAVERMEIYEHVTQLSQLPQLKTVLQVTQRKTFLNLVHITGSYCGKRHVFASTKPHKLSEVGTTYNAM